MTRTLMIAGAVLAATPSFAAAQEGRPESYMRFFGGVHEPVSKRTSGTVPGAFTEEGLADVRLVSIRGLDDAADFNDADFRAVSAAADALDAALGGRRQETSMGYGLGALIGVRVSPRIGAELEVAHRSHDVEGSTSEQLYDANADAFTGAFQGLLDTGAATAPAVVEPEGAEQTLAVTTYMANASYFFPAWGRVAPYASAGLGWASPAGDVSDYKGNVAYQVRAGADLDLGLLLLGVQGTYVGAGDFERELPAVELTPPLTGAAETFGGPGQATVEYGTAEVAVTVTVPLSRR